MRRTFTLFLVGLMATGYAARAGQGPSPEAACPAGIADPPPPSRLPAASALRSEVSRGADPALDLGVGGDHDGYHLEVLALEGDWMRVSVVEPSDYCADEGMVPQRREGWVKWRGPDVGPWIWYYTRGC